MTNEQIILVLKSQKALIDNLLKRVDALESYIKFENIKKEAEKHPKDWRII